MGKRGATFQDGDPVADHINAARLYALQSGRHHTAHVIAAVLAHVLAAAETPRRRRKPVTVPRRSGVSTTAPG